MALPQPLPERDPKHTAAKAMGEHERRRPCWEDTQSPGQGSAVILTKPVHFLTVESPALGKYHPPKLLAGGGRGWVLTALLLLDAFWHRPLNLSCFYLKLFKCECLNMVTPRDRVTIPMIQTRALSLGFNGLFGVTCLKPGPFKGSFSLSHCCLLNQERGDTYFLPTRDILPHVTTNDETELEQI